MWHAVDDASRSRQVNFAQVSVGSSLLVVMRKIWLPEQLISASNFSRQVEICIFRILTQHAGKIRHGDVWSGIALAGQQLRPHWTPPSTELPV